MGRVEGQDEAARGASDGDVAQPAFLLDGTLRVGRSLQRAAVREALLLESDDNDRRPLASLGAMDRHQLDRRVRVAKPGEAGEDAVAGVQEEVEAGEGGGPAQERVEGGVVVVPQRVVAVATPPAPQGAKP